MVLKPFKERLQKDIESAIIEQDCKRYLLNHLAFCPDQENAKEMIDFRIQCMRCN